MLARSSRRLLGFSALVAVVAGAYWYVLESRPCVKPVSYKIGTFDTRFDIDREDFLGALDEASAIWEQAIGMDLFVYDSEGKVAVNLIFDERQKGTEEQEVLLQEIEGFQSQYEAKKAFLASRTAYYEAQSGEYENQVSAYQVKIAAYEADVRYWNRRGGAPEKEYQELQAMKSQLQAQKSALEGERLALNALADEVNALVSLVNALAKQTNDAVERYNASDLVGTQFDQGIYRRDGGKVSISIYQFTDHGKLVRVLAHELGHVLGLEHNKNPDSIMYELNRSDNEEVSPDDLASLKEVCRIAAK